jgi:hypothetical protein
MRPFRMVFYFVSLCMATLVNAQPRHADLPSYLRGTWTTQNVVFGERNATIKLPEGWAIREGGISVSDAESSDCKIDFALETGDFEQRLAEKLAADRRISRYALHSELSRAGGVRMISVRYADGTDRFVEKRYFELTSDEGNTLMEWILNAQSTSHGKDCRSRFNAVASSLRVISNR